MRRSVSLPWKKNFDAILQEWSGLLHAFLNYFGWEKRHLTMPMIRWMFRYRIHLGSLGFDAELADIPLLCTILERCHADRLTKMNAWVNRNGMESSVTSSLQMTSRPKEVIDLVNENTVLPWMFPPKHCTDLKDLHNLIAAKCPSLLDLGVSLTLPASTHVYTEYISQDLFSMSTIKVLRLSVGLHVTLEVRIWIRLQVPLAKTITVDAANGVDLDVQ
jgi:hypothetical protein